MKDMRGGDRARWICDALHSIMLMRRIIMSPPQAVEAQCGHKCVSLLMLGFVCKAVHVCVCVVHDKSSKPNLSEMVLFSYLDIFALCPL